MGDRKSPDRSRHDALHHFQNYQQDHGDNGAVGGNADRDGNISHRHSPERTQPHSERQDREKASGYAPTRDSPDRPLRGQDAYDGKLQGRDTGGSGVDRADTRDHRRSGSHERSRDRDRNDRRASSRDRAKDRDSGGWKKGRGSGSDSDRSQDRSRRNRESPKRRHSRTRDRKGSRDRVDSPRRDRDRSPRRIAARPQQGVKAGISERGGRASSPRQPFGERLPSPAPPPGMTLPRRVSPGGAYNNTDTLENPPSVGERGPEFSLKTDNHDEHIDLAYDIYDCLVKERKPVIHLRCWLTTPGAVFWAVKTLTLVYNMLQGSYDVLCFPISLSQEDVVLQCFLQPAMDPDWTVEAYKLRVASDSLPARVATSVKVTFLKGRKCFLVACGWDPVKVAVFSLWYAQRFLQEDWWEGVRLAFRSRYVELTGCKGIEMNVMVAMPNSFAQVGCGNPTCSSVWVGNVHCSEDTLWEEFSKHGPLDTVRLLGNDKDGGQFGYANFKTCEFAVAAQQAMDGAKVGKSRIDVKFAKMSSNTREKGAGRSKGGSSWGKGNSWDTGGSRGKGGGDSWHGNRTQRSGRRSWSRSLSPRGRRRSHSPSNAKRGRRHYSSDSDDRGGRGTGHSSWRRGGSRTPPRSAKRRRGSRSSSRSD